MNNTVSLELSHFLHLTASENMWDCGTGTISLALQVKNGWEGGMEGEREREREHDLSARGTLSLNWHLVLIPDLGPSAQHTRWALRG